MYKSLDMKMIICGDSIGVKGSEVKTILAYVQWNFIYKNIIE